MSYADFLALKVTSADKPGREVSTLDVHPMLHGWQKELVQWAVRTSRAAIWADTGLGKTVMQLEWARLSGDTALVVAPLAVCEQTVREAAKLGIQTTYVRHGEQITGPGIWVTNYEMVPHFPADLLDAVVLDESSILKQSNGATHTMLIEHFRSVPHRLACSATPAPNDPEELTSQSEWLGRMSRSHMLAAYFIHDSDGWRLKGHAKAPMMRWMTQWAVAIRKPSDMGYDDTGYDLPGLTITPHLLAVDIQPEDQLFATEIGGVSGRAMVRRQTLDARVEKAVELVYDCGAQGLRQGILRSEQGEVGSRRVGAGTTEYDEAQEVCRGRRIPSQDVSPDVCVQEGPTASSDSHHVRDGRGRSGTPSRPGVSDLSCDQRGQRRIDVVCGPQTQYGHGSRCSLSAMQPSVGLPPGRSYSDHGDVRLPHACRDQWVIWCGLNAEQDALAEALGNDCRSLDGRTPIDERVHINESWIRGDFRFLIVKPGMYSQGMNWQHCARMAFVGLGDSYEQYYQAIRRCYRYGQTRVVQAHVILSDLEGQIATNVARKERQHSDITTALVAEMRRARNEMSVPA